MKYPIESCYGSRVRGLARKIDSIYRKHLSDTSITENQLSIMMALYKTGPVEQNRIGEILNLEKSSLSRNLRRILQSKYLVKTGQVNRPVLKLTNEGKKKVEKIGPQWEKAMDEVSSVLSEAEINGFELFEKKIREL